MPDLSKRINDIKSELRKYQKNVKRLNSDLKLLQLDLSLLLGDDTTNKPRYRMEFAVDYDIVHSFAFTHYRPDELVAKLLDEHFWKKLDEDRLFGFFLLEIFRNQLVLLPPHAWEMEDKRRVLSMDYGKVRDWFKDETLPLSLRALSDDEDQDNEITKILDTGLNENDISPDKIKVLIEFVKDRFPDIYAALTFDSNMGIGTLNSLLSRRLVTYQDMFENLDINVSEVNENSGSILDWLNEKRPNRSKSNLRDAIAITYLNKINEKTQENGILILLATDTSRLRDLTDEVPLSCIKIPGRKRKLSLVRDKSYWKTYLQYFQGSPGEEICDTHYKDTLELVDNDKKYVDGFIGYINNIDDIDTYVRNDDKAVQHERIKTVNTTIDIVKGILEAVDDRKNLQLALSHQWREHGGKPLLKQVNGTIARRAQVLMKILKEGLVQDALHDEIDNIGKHITKITLVLGILINHNVNKKNFNSAIVRHLLGFEDPTVQNLKENFFDTNGGYFSKGVGSMALPSMREKQEDCENHPEIFALTAYILAKSREFDLALQEVTLGLGYAKDSARSMLFLVEAMANLGKKEFSSAIQSCRNGLDLQPNNSSLQVFLGYSLWSAFKHQPLKVQELDEAIDVTIEATKASNIPGHSIGISNLAYFYAERGDLKSACSYLQKLEEVMPDKNAWPSLYKNSEAFVLLKMAVLDSVESHEQRLAYLRKASKLFKEALTDSDHYQVKENYNICNEFLRSLEKDTGQQFRDGPETQL